jgi:hypothetical protein
MNIFELVKKVESSDVFKELDKGSYLVHVFSIVDPEHVDEWQVGYYNKEKDHVSVFDFKDGKISIMPPQEAFKESNYIAKLDLKDVKIDFDDAENIVNDVMKKNYSAETIVKSIVLLQNLPEFGQLWNMSIVTTTFSVINIKINAKEGSVIKHTKESLMGWNKK